MQEFVVKGKEVFLGLEDSKRTWKVCVRCDGMIVQEASMPTGYEHLQTFLLRCYPECKIRVIYEAGFHGFWLHDLLEEAGIDCVVTPPCKVTQEKVNKVKTDRIDARRLAKVLESGDYTSCWVPDQELREDRQISRMITQLQRNITRTKNQIRKFLDFHGLNGDFPAGRWGALHYQQLRSIKLSPMLQICLDTYFRMLDQAVAIRKNLLIELRRLSRKDRYRQSVQLKESCPGVGWLSAIRFTLEWGEMSRFRCGKHLGSYLGLTASEYSTGDTVRRGRITREGKSQVRAWLIECAWTSLRMDPVLMKKFNRVWANSGSKKKAIVAVARKLAGRMLILEERNEPYHLGLIE
jgi:transposase